MNGVTLNLSSGLRGPGLTCELKSDLMYKIYDKFEENQPVPINEDLNQESGSEFRPVGTGGLPI